MKKPEVIELIRKSVIGEYRLYPLLHHSAIELLEYIEEQENTIKERENAINNARKYIQDNAYYSVNNGTATLTLENEDFYELEEMLRLG